MRHSVHSIRNYLGGLSRESTSILIEGLMKISKILCKMNMPQPKSSEIHVGFEVFTAVVMKSIIF
jgi:hypothetical protein